MRRIDLEIEQPRQGGDRAVGVERAQQEMSRLGSAERHLGGHLVADLADHDHFRVVAQEGSQVAGERVADRLVDFRLAQLLVDVLDRVLGGQDADLRRVDAHQARVERRRLAGSRRARDQKDARRALQQAVEALARRSATGRARSRLRGARDRSSTRMTTLSPE